MQKKLRSPSIKDIAKLSGVSISTVSNILNNKNGASKETKKRVLKIIEEHNYRRNTMAIGLRTRNTKIIGVIVPDIATPFTSQVVKGIELVASERNYTTVLCCNYYDVKKEENQVNMLFDLSVDGIIFFNGYDNSELIKRIKGEKPILLLDREIESEKLEIPSVLVNNISAVENAVNYLYKKGHKKIGFITFGYENQTVVRNRFLGYCKGLKNNNIKYNPDYVINDEAGRLKEIDETYLFMKKYLKNKDLPTAFITISDFHAYGLLKALKEEKFSIPKDISVIGFDNINFSNFVDPPLTTIKQPKLLMGKTGMNLLIDLIERKRVKIKQIVLETNIIERNTVSSINSNKK